MLILLDKQRQIVSVFTASGKHDIPFDAIDELEDIIGNQEALYVTNAVKARSGEIIDLVNALSPQPVAATPIDINSNLSSEVCFLQSKASGPVFVTDLNVTFMGPDDCKRIDENMSKIISSSLTVQAMLRSQQLEILDYNSMQRVVKQQQRIKSRKQDATTSAQDAQLDSILVEQGVKAEDARNIASSAGSGVIDIEIGGDVRRT